MLFFSQASSLPFFLPNTSALSVYSQKFLLFPNCSLVEFSALNLLFSSLAPVLSASLVLSAGSSSWADPAPEEWKVVFFFFLAEALPKTFFTAQALQGERKSAHASKNQTQELSEVAVSF